MTEPTTARTDPLLPDAERIAEMRRRNARAAFEPDLRLLIQINVEDVPLLLYAVEQLGKYADQAEAAVERVREVLDAMRKTPGTRAWADRLDTALTGTAPRPGLRVHELRTARGWTLAELGRAAGLTRETVRNIETGDTAPLPESLDALASALGVPRATLEPQATAAGPPRMAEHGVAYLTDTGRYVIADHGGWLTGTYATEDAARLALTVDDTQLVALRDRINRDADRGITVADLRPALDHTPPKES
ncbi:helix-turn-helix domain-containing protein [Actinomadura sp. WMMA1423]|uniref:helix-turn-helix domain-containing protein n=1 Tax=Actinomadura sp. WMMA1423 TaxID=2591108 RepID=UPI00143CDFDF|nr:helix-turn-helix transcriptional regulator [Actinomadura sp. WMMA1423]